MTRPVLRTELCELLGIEYPILLAGMGVWGMATPPGLVAAVSEAGGAGVLGCSGLVPDEIRRRILEVRQLTDKPFGVDLLLPAKLAQAAPTRAGVWDELNTNFPEHVAFQRELMARFELPETHAEDENVLSPEFMARQVEVVLEERVPIFAAGLGDPAIVVPRARAQGMTVLGLTGTVRNARRQVEAGVDIVVCQGTEGGGHTGRVASLPLIPQTVDAVAPLPVVAAGGITDGRGIAAALALGAVGAWIGTAFLVAEECAMPDPLKQMILGAGAPDFVTSRAWTGKPVRNVRNPVVEAWDKSGLDPLPTPYQRVLMEDLLAAVRRTGRWELFMNAAGQGGGMLTERRPAAAIMADLVEGAVKVLDGLPERVATS